MPCSDSLLHWTGACVCAAQIVIMGRDLNQAADHDLSPMISSGHIVVQPPSKPWRDFLKYIEASRRACTHSLLPMITLMPCAKPHSMPTSPAAARSDDVTLAGPV